MCLMRNPTQTILISPHSLSFDRWIRSWAVEHALGIKKIQVALPPGFAGAWARSKLIPGKNRLISSRRHGISGDYPAAATRNPTPTLALRLGIGAGEPHTGSILGISGLLGLARGSRLLLLSRRQQGTGGVSGFNARATAKRRRLRMG